MPLNLIPQTLCGFNLNSILAYTTVKVVRIHDRHLGCLHYMWMLLIAAWVIGFQILYGNNHYELKDVQGVARLTIQQPTKKGCNPNKPDCEDDLLPMSALPYCKAYTGPELVDAPIQEECIYADQHEMLPGGMLEGTMFVPTRIDKMVETKHCDPNESNGFHCKKMWKMEENHENTYVADIEDYTVLVVSSYYRGKILGTSTDHQGFYYECRDKETNKIIGTDKCDSNELKVVMIDCLPFLDCGYKIKEEPPHSPAFLQRRFKSGYQQSIALDANQTSEFTPGPVFSIPSGDIFRMSKLLELAGLELDGSEKHGESLRQRGTRLKIGIEYANLYHWTGITKPGYIYKVVHVPTDEMKTEMYTHSQPESFPAKRTLENRHGIYISAEVSGSFGFFDIVYLLVMLTTSLALLSAGTTVIDLLADYVPGLHVERDKYQHVFRDDDHKEH